MSIQEAKKYLWNVLYVVPKNKREQLLKSLVEQTAVAF